MKYNKEDIELLLLFGQEIDIDIGKIYPLKLKDIIKLGYSKYNVYLSLLLLDKNNLNNTNDINIDLSQYSNFDVVYSICMVDEKFKQSYFTMLELFFKETIYLGGDIFYFGEFNKGKDNNRIINKDNFDEIIELLKVVNNISSIEDDLNPADARTKELLEKRKKVREMVAKAKSKDNDGEPLTLSDLVSSLCANSNSINLFNVWDLTIYQFNNQFNRMRMLEDYDINIRSLLAGGDPEKINLKHWMSKIE